MRWNGNGWQAFKPKQTASSLPFLLTASVSFFLSPLAFCSHLCTHLILYTHTHTHTSIHVFFRPVSISKPFYRKRANVTNAAVLSPGGFTLTICLHKISFANHFHSSDICFCPLCLVIWEYLLMPHIQTNSEIALSLSHFDACLWNRVTGVHWWNMLVCAQVSTFLPVSASQYLQKGVCASAWLCW